MVRSAWILVILVICLVSSIGASCKEVPENSIENSIEGAIARGIAENVPGRSEEVPENSIEEAIARGIRKIPLGRLLCTLSQVNSSLFTFGTDSWLADGDFIYEAGREAPTHSPSGGNPGGYLSVNDDVLNGVWYWFAPSNYLGNKSCHFGKHLKYDLKQTETSDQFATGDVWMVGTDGTTLVYFDQANYDNSEPRTSWTSYLIKLDETAGWKIEPTNTPFANDTDPFLSQWSQARLASDAEIRDVLTSLGALYIRGEFRDGPDTGSLDNVFFGMNGQ